MSTGTGERSLIIPLDEYTQVYKKALEQLDVMKPEFDKYNAAVSERRLRANLNDRRDKHNARWLVAYGALLTDDQLDQIKIESVWHLMSLLPASLRSAVRPMWSWEEPEIAFLKPRVKDSFDPSKYWPFDHETENKIAEESAAEEAKAESNEYHMLRGTLLQRLQQFEGVDGGVVLDTEALDEYKKAKNDGCTGQAKVALAQWRMRAQGEMKPLLPLLEDEYASLVEEFESWQTRTQAAKEANANNGLGTSPDPYAATAVVIFIIITLYAAMKLLF